MADKKAALDTELVNDLARILNETDLTEIEVEQGDLRIRVSRETAPQIIGSPMPQMVPTPPAQAPVQAPAASAPTEDGQPAAQAPAAARSGHEVPAPMVGTAYLAPAPDAEAFVKVGANVTEGETLLIIEAMKVMNQIAAPRTGKISEILIDDGEPVEFGQPLLVIE